MNYSAADHVHMAHALRLAERGLHTTQPNPRVGCIIARGDQVVGAGWHARAGEPHAEVLALREAAEAARGATAYVTLEPCGLQGRTPPCADALIATGIARVVIASEDAFQREGEAIGRLRAAGIAVETGLLRDAARELNRGFFSRVERGRPWLRIKLACSLDGRTALRNGASKWITGADARADVQDWRARSSALMTGIGTVLSDDPRLTVRRTAAEPPWEGGAQRGTTNASIGKSQIAPLRVLLDSSLRTPPGSNLLDGSVATLVFHAPGARPGHAGFDRVERFAVEALDRCLDLHAILRVLGQRGINELQVEAGPTLCGALIQAELADELLQYTAPVLLGDHGRPLLALPEFTDLSQARRLRVVDRRQIGVDERILFRD